LFGVFFMGRIHSLQYNTCLFDGLPHLFRFVSLKNDIYGHHETKNEDGEDTERKAPTLCSNQKTNHYGHEKGSGAYAGQDQTAGQSLFSNEPSRYPGHLWGKSLRIDADGHYQAEI